MGPVARQQHVLLFHAKTDFWVVPVVPMAVAATALRVWPADAFQSQAKWPMFPKILLVTARAAQDSLVKTGHF